jgi:mRNA interferase YafQ
VSGEDKYKVKWSTRFKKDYKLAMKRGYDIGLLDDVIRLIAKGEILFLTLR